ncbi:MAG TPA: adenylate kinase [Candidatus Thermoplasmatota archaeon]|nr:adenylate kinase [Candidatus Thermoplasmatota archaeon]
MGAIIVTGIPGVGKTTVMEAAAKARDLRIAVYGTVMFEVASAKGLVQSRDEMRRLPAETQKAIQREAARRIAGMGDVIVDTHCSIKTPTGYLPGLPAWVLAELEPTALVLVEADPEEILRRRQGDATRRRDDDTLQAIAEHQEYNRRFAAACATLTGATVHTVHNKDGAVEAALEQMLPVLGAGKAKPATVGAH